MRSMSHTAGGAILGIVAGAASSLCLWTATAAAQPVPETEAPVEAAPVEAAPVEPPPAAPPPPAEVDADRPSLAPTLSGHVAATYNFNFMDPALGTTPFHSYTAKHNSFLLNHAHVMIAGSDEAIAYSVEIDAGTDAIFNTVGSYFDVQEAWVSYTAPSGLGFKAGKFVTFNGIEVIESPSNPTISRGFLFGLAEPFAHVGVLGIYQASDTLDFAVGAVNGWDLIVDNNDNKTLVAKVGVTQDKLGLIVSAYAGKETGENYRATLDATAVVKLAKLDLWLQGNVGFEEGVALDGEDAMWMGFGVQPVFKIDDKLSLGARLEAFIDGDGARTTVDQTLINVSVAPAYKVHDRVTVRAEGRLDFSTEDVFVSDDVTADPGAIQVIALTEASVAF